MPLSFNPPKLPLRGLGWNNLHLTSLSDTSHLGSFNDNPHNNGDMRDLFGTELTGFLHFEHVTEPQSGQIKRRCLGRAKKPDEHFEHEGRRREGELT